MNRGLKICCHGQLLLSLSSYRPKEIHNFSHQSSMSCLDELNSEKDKKIELQKEEIRKLKDEQIKTDEIEMLKKQLDEMKSEKDKEILQLKQNEEEKISLIRTDFSSQLESMKERINQLTEKTKEEKTTTPLASIRFLGNSNHKGLISMLENVTISATGYINKHDPITNIKTYDNKIFSIIMMAPNLSQTQTL